MAKCKLLHSRPKHLVKEIAKKVVDIDSTDSEDIVLAASPLQQNIDVTSDGVEPQRRMQVEASENDGKKPKFATTGQSTS